MLGSIERPWASSSFNDYYPEVRAQGPLRYLTSGLSGLKKQGRVQGAGKGSEEGGPGKNRIRKSNYLAPLN